MEVLILSDCYPRFQGKEREAQKSSCFAQERQNLELISIRSPGQTTIYSIPCTSVLESLQTVSGRIQHTPVPTVASGGRDKESEALGWAGRVAFH